MRELGITYTAAERQAAKTTPEKFTPDLASDHFPLRETCEQRRAREYGLEETPAPNGRDYDDPIVHAAAFRTWKERVHEALQRVGQ